MDHYAYIITKNKIKSVAAFVHLVIFHVVNPNNLVVVLFRQNEGPKKLERNYIQNDKIFRDNRESP